MDRTWTVEIRDKKHLVELDYPTNQEFSEMTGVVKEGKKGKLVIDGNEVGTWKGAEFPKEISFEIDGKPCVLRKKGLFAGKLELFLEDKLIKSA